jgi:hypothetical protein
LTVKSAGGLDIEATPSLVQAAASPSLALDSGIPAGMTSSVVAFF